MNDPGCARTVLIVDDDTDVRDAIAEVLEDGNYRPLRAENGAVALQQLRGATPMPCVILLDVMMPVMDGNEFRARQQSDASLREIPVVVLSAHADASVSAAQMRAAAFLKKPVDLGELLQTIQHFCEKE
jgi:CheY-like chemotaxis protein